MAAVSLSHVGFGLGSLQPTHEVQVVVSAMFSTFGLNAFTFLEILLILLYGSDSCPTNAAVKHSFEFTLNRVLFKIFGALPKDTYRDICNILV